MTDDDRRSTVETSRINDNKSNYNMKLLNFIFIIKVLAQSNLFKLFNRRFEILRERLWVSNALKII